MNRCYLLLLLHTIEERMFGKATREKKGLQMLSDISSRTYEALKRQEQVAEENIKSAA